MASRNATRTPGYFGMDYQLLDAWFRYWDGEEGTLAVATHVSTEISNNRGLIAMVLQRSWVPLNSAGRAAGLFIPLTDIYWHCYREKLKLLEFCTKIRKEYDTEK